jgi:hypothetical protein
MAKRKREYDNEFPSVTQVLDCLRKPGLEMWYRINTPQFIQEAMVKGRTIGTATHAAIESYINTGALTIDTEYPDEVTMALNSFVLFRKEHPEIKLRHSETKMTSLVHGVNGTMDIVGEIEIENLAGDWKTTAAKDKEKPEIYDEAKTQVSAYRALWNELFPATPLDRAFIVSLAKDKVAYAFEIIEKEELESRFNEIFLSALKIKQYQTGAKYVKFWNKS